MRNILKICILGPAHWSASMGGIEYQVRLLINSLRDNKNVEVYFVARDAADGYCPTGYNLIKLKRNIIKKYSFFADALELYKILHKIKPNVIYQNGGTAHLAIASYYAKKEKCELIWHVASDNDLLDNDRIFSIKKIHRYFDRWALRYGVKNVSKIVVQTRRQKCLVKKINGKAEIAHIRNYHPFPSKNNPFKKNKVIWVANLKLLKQPDVFLDMAQKLLVNGIHTECVMIGAPAAYPADYQALLESKMKMLDNVKYLGKQSNDYVNLSIAESKVFVNTSKWEGFPNTYIQSWMRRTPVVCLHCDPDDTIKKYGIGFKSNNLKDLVRDVTFLLENEKARNEMGIKAQEYAYKYHSMRNLEQLIEFILTRQLSK